MPNFCFNQLVVSGPREWLEKFDNNFTSYTSGMSDEEKEEHGLKRCFNSLVPIEPWTADIAKKRWGTKWDIYADNIDVEKNKDNFVYYFQTACSPPLSFVMEASRRHPVVGFAIRFSEPGVSFMGENCYQARNMISHRIAYTIDGMKNITKNNEFFKSEMESMEESITEYIDEWVDEFKEKYTDELGVKYDDILDNVVEEIKNEYEYSRIVSSLYRPLINEVFKEKFLTKVKDKEDIKELDEKISNIEKRSE